MKQLIKYFIFLSVAICIGMLIALRQGYVLIAYGNTVFEMTLWVAIFLVVVIFALLYFSLRFINVVHHGPQKLKRYWRYYSLAKSQRYINRGLLRLLEKNWVKAENHFAKAITLQPKHRSSLVAYLAIAYVANAQRKHDKVTSYLNQAQKYYGNRAKNLLTLQIFKQYLLMTNHQYEEALAFICALRVAYPRHKLLIENLKTIYLSQQDWYNLKKILPIVKKYNILSNDEFISLKSKTYLELWKDCLKLNDKTEIVNFWRKLPYDLRYNHEFADLYIDFLHKNYSVAKAEKFLLKFLQKNWHALIVAKYGLLNSDDPWKQLNTLEAYLDKYPQEKELFLALSRVCERLNLSAKQHYYFAQYSNTQ